MSSNHVTEDLPLLLTGDANRDVVMTAATHLRACEDCRQELVSAVVAHSSLMSAHRFAPEIVEAAGLDEKQFGPAEDHDELPDLSAVFADVRAEAATAPAATGSRDDLAAQRERRRGRMRLAAVGAAAAVLIGGGLTYVAASGDSDSSSRTVALDATSGKDAKATLVGGDRMRVDASDLPALSGGRQYEVWLARGPQRQSIGFLGRDGRADLRVPTSVMSRYQRIAVSVQREGQTEFSGNVVLSGTYG